MLLVKTKIKESDVHGIGLFADQFIPKGTLIWSFLPNFDMKFTLEQILEFPDLVQIYFYKYSWKNKKDGLYYVSSDNEKHFNHSLEPNCEAEYVNGGSEMINVAIKDIQLGEEMLMDYSSFEDMETDLEKIAKKFNLKDELDPRFKNL